MFNDVENKNIVYSDTLLLEKIRSGLEIKCISNVEPSSLERCISAILQSNIGVKFDTIQYLENEKKVCFYTDSSIYTGGWKATKTGLYDTRSRVLDNRSEILEELKKILSSENKESDCISVYEVFRLMNRMKEEKSDLLEHSRRRFNKILGFGFYPKIKRLLFDDLRLLIIWNDDSWHFLNKRDGDLYVSESKLGSLSSLTVLTYLGNNLDKLYDQCRQFSNDMHQEIRKLATVNSDFFVEINSEKMSIYTSPNGFKLYWCDSTNSFECNGSNSIINIIKGLEEEIFKRTFVKIENCPKWSRVTLYEMRQNQLLKEKIDKMKPKQLAKEKKHKMIKSIFSFFK